MPDIIYCKNYDCPHNKKLEEPVSFKFSPLVTPFEGDKCKGKCGAAEYALLDFEETIKDFVYEGSECFRNQVGEADSSSQSACMRIDCAHNEKTKCTRPEILIDKLNSLWVCKCFSFRKIRGHTDWFRLLNADGTAKGGHIDDAYAQKINKYAKTTRSYRSHMKQNT